MGDGTHFMDELIEVGIKTFSSVAELSDASN